MVCNTDMSTLNFLAPSKGLTLWVAVVLLAGGAVKAQPSVANEVGAKPSAATIAASATAETDSSSFRAFETAQGSADDAITIKQQLAENKLRDKFNAFDYTDELPPNLGFAEFEQSLEQRFFGTYVFYSKLNDEQRLRVYESYQRDRHISAIRTSTLDLLH